MKVKGFTVSYDAFADVLYISEGKPFKATETYEDEDYIIVRSLKNKIKGITIDGYKRMKQENIWKDEFILKYLPDFKIKNLII